ncbi:hypothetical protein GCM10010211_70020 [Streptomyces albospinus]|uniref:Uncharacterized protein n=1 Tax=Streptomyces albospinus TaxID=285515 RepID=A0ABQ2VM73_9ACTN|nr:hypothetical protein GCM10010211_70020 [Streptomyces albospinus]
MPSPDIPDTEEVSNIPEVPDIPDGWWSGVLRSFMVRFLYHVRTIRTSTPDRTCLPSGTALRKRQTEDAAGWAPGRAAYRGPRGRGAVPE